MERPVTARELRSLLALARKLRALAGEPLMAEADRSLYLSAAAALESRANRLATSLPDDFVWDLPDSHPHIDVLI